MNDSCPPPALKLTLKDLSSLVSELKMRSFEVIAPTPQDGVIVYDTIENLDDLPIGLADEQECGTYRLKQRSDRALFGFNNGPSSLKRYLFPPEQLLWKASKDSNGLKIVSELDRSCSDNYQKRAFLGVRPCDLKAVLTQDTVFLEQDRRDEVYLKKRAGMAIISVNCSQAAPTCFCTSMGSGPQAGDGFDIALTEILHEEEHFFVAKVGTDLGKSLLSSLNLKKATKEMIKLEEAVLQLTAKSIQRNLDTTDIRERLYNSYDENHWEAIAERCLACANCTMVCPTCFCNKVADLSDLSGAHAERWRSWDSCFTSDFSYIHGGVIRSSIKSRYRQWLTHKLATWQDQFGSSGCVGCGRCITWCPVGIDLTEEVPRFGDSAA